jgi:DNA-binding HxlR family transcriptional regulator
LLSLQDELNLHVMVADEVDADDPRRWSMDNCTLARAAAVLADKWTFVLLRDVFMGVRRFSELAERNGIPRQVLTNRLNLLVEQDILRRRSYQEPGSRPRAEYVLTPKGVDLHPILVALRAWGDTYAADPEGPPLLTVHRDCGAAVEPQLRCSEGHAVGSPDEIVRRPGPSAHRAVPAP